MTENFLVRVFEHNNWANEKILQACYALSDDQLDAEPRSATQGSIRSTLVHLVSSQRGYLALLTLPVEERPTSPVDFADLEASVRTSGEGLLELASGARKPLASRLTTRDKYYTEPWVVMLQVINHATEHREQIKSMLSALGLIPPDIDGWDFGLTQDALVPISTGSNSETS